MFQMFHLFQTYVASVLFGCCKTRSGCYIYIYASVSSVFIRMLQVFHLDVCNGHTRVFKFFLMFRKYFKYMLQVLQLFCLDVVKVDRVLHMLQCT
jgi:hypothetical protein